MSEPVSAFAAYNKANGVDAKNTGSKAKPKQKSASTKNEAPKAANTKKSGAVTNGSNKKNTVSPKESKKGKKQMDKAKPEPKAKPAPKSRQKSNNDVGIHPNEIDQMVEELIKSPKSEKNLTKAQQKKKKELEDYLVRQLEQDDEDNASVSDFNSDSEEEQTSNSDSMSEDETPEDSHDLPLQNSKPKTSPGNKRKSVDSIQNDTKEKSSNARKASIPSTSAAASTLTNGVSVPKKAKKNDKTKVAASNQVESNTDTTPTKNTAGPNVKVVKIEPVSPPSNIIKMSSITEGLKVFQWLLNPINVNDFFAKYWERGACLVKRNISNYYQHLISFEAIDQMLLKNHVQFTKNIDVTSYKNGIRETLNPDGRAMPPVVWEHYGNGCSIRLLNPQTFMPELFKLNSTLQEYFHCMVGANAYLTPPNSQGFAPHYDDIEAFVLQVEGRKRWKLYKPRNKSEELPRYSSPNFNQNEIGKPIMEEVLQPGDILYFPRGTIHQACTEPGYHSLHITLSVYQKQSYADLFEKMMPLLLQRAIESSVDMRRGLPLHVWHNAGIAFSDNDTKERKEFTDTITKMLNNLTRNVNVTEIMDAAVDQQAKKFQHEALPPVVLPSERRRTIFGSVSTTNEHGECICDYDINLTTNVRLLRANILHLVKEEEEKLRIYYYSDNSKEYCEYEPNFIEIEPEDGGSVEVLIKSYPEYIGVSQLPIEDDERKISMVTALWERGLLMMEKPIE